jgi:hypothetical protein
MGTGGTATLFVLITATRMRSQASWTFSVPITMALTLSNLLDIRAQSEAKMTWGFDEGHATILSSKEVIEQYNSIPIRLVLRFIV